MICCRFDCGLVFRMYYVSVFMIFFRFVIVLLVVVLCLVFVVC